MDGWQRFDETIEFRVGDGCVVMRVRTPELNAEGATTLDLHYSGMIGSTLSELDQVGLHAMAGSIGATLRQICLLLHCMMIAGMKDEVAGRETQEAIDDALYEASVSCVKIARKYAGSEADLEGVIVN